MRLRLIGFILLAYFVSAVATQAAVPAPILKVDASSLTVGAKPAQVTNGGSLGGTLTAVGQVLPVVESVAGKTAFTFNGGNGFKSDFTVPDTVTGVNPWTVSTWIYNPTISTDGDFYFMWARRPSSGEANGRCGEMAYTNSGWGAAPHNGNWDIGWGRLNGPPAAATWHNITVTYDGANSLNNGTAVGTGTEIVYVDGVVVSVHVGKPLDLFKGGNFLVGFENNSTYEVNTVGLTGQANRGGFSGSIASLQMWDSALAAADVVSLAGSTRLNVGTVTDLIMNNSFESYTFGGKDNNNATAGGYWTGFAYQAVPAGGTGNQYIKIAHASYTANNTDHWNNGANVDGYAVMALEGTAPTKVYLSQAVFGIEPNSDYKIWGYFNSRQRGTSSPNYGQLELKMDGVDLLSPSPKQITPVDPAATHNTPFTRVEVPWRSNDLPGHYITFGQVGASGSWNSINCDKLCMAKVGGPAKPVLMTKELPALTSLDFFGVQAGSTGTKVFYLVNDGGSDMKINGLPAIGTDGYLYSATPSSDTVPAYGGMVQVTVTFSPTAVGTFNNAQLKIDTDAPTGPLYLPLTGYSKLQVANGSFEQIYMNTGGGDWQGSYPGWTSNGVPPVTNDNAKIGFAQNGQWKLDNGKFADGSQGAQLQNNQKNDSAVTLGQTIPGFVKNHKYHFRFYANSFKGTTSNAFDGQAWSDFKVNGVSATGVQVTRGTTTTSVDFPTTVTNREAGGTRNTIYDNYDYEWTAPDNGAYPIEFSCIGNAKGDGNNALLLDAVNVWDTNVPGPATVNTTKLDFGNKAINTTSTLNVTVTNWGGMDLKITTATFSGGQVTQFGPNTTLPQTVAKYNGTYNFSVKYMNTTFGQKDSTLTLMCDSGEKFIIALTANTAFAAYGPMFQNGNLEAGTLSKPTDANKNNTPTGWGWASGTSNQGGRSWSGSLYNNNGINPDGGAAAWIYKSATDTTRTLRQDISGFRAGKTYRISLYANASDSYPANAAISDPGLAVSGSAQLVINTSKNDDTNSANLLVQTINKVENYGSYTTNWPLITTDWVAPSWVTPGTIVRLSFKLGATATADCLLLDGIKVQELAPGIQVSPTSVRFSTVNWYKNDKPSTATVTITNNGLNTLNLTGGATGYPGLTIVDTQFYNASKQPDPQYSFVSITPANKTSLAAGESVSVVVKFNPTKKGDYTASALLRVTSNDPNFSQFDVPLMGDAVPVELSTFSAE